MPACGRQRTRIISILFTKKTYYYYAYSINYFLDLILFNSLNFLINDQHSINK